MGVYYNVKGFRRRLEGVFCRYFVISFVFGEGIFYFVEVCFFYRGVKGLKFGVCLFNFVFLTL